MAVKDEITPEQMQAVARDILFQRYVYVPDALVAGVLARLACVTVTHVGNGHSRIELLPEPGEVIRG